MPAAGKGLSSHPSYFPGLPDFPLAAGQARLLLRAAGEQTLLSFGNNTLFHPGLSQQLRDTKGGWRFRQ